MYPQLFMQQRQRELKNLSENIAFVAKNKITDKMTLWGYSEITVANLNQKISVLVEGLLELNRQSVDSIMGVFFDESDTATSLNLLLQSM